MYHYWMVTVTQLREVPESGEVVVETHSARYARDVYASTVLEPGEYKFLLGYYDVEDSYYRMRVVLREGGVE